MKIFKDRQAAGKLLVNHLKEYKQSFPLSDGKRKGNETTVVLGIPRGGVVVAKEVANELNLPLDIVVTRKIGHPNQQELAIGAVDADGVVVWDQNLGREFKGLEELVKNEVEEIKRREKLYRQGKKPLEVSGKVAILVDDGIATGATILSAVNYLKRHSAKKIVLAVPVSGIEAKNKLSNVVDEIVVLETPEYFMGVGQFYQNFLPVSDQEVIQFLSDE